MRARVLEALAMAATTISIFLVATIVLSILLLPVIVITGSFPWILTNILRNFGVILFLFMGCALLAEKKR